MTIPHEDLIRAVLDGKTVQWRDDHHDWRDCFDGGIAVIAMVQNKGSSCFRLKPEPRCYWSASAGDFKSHATYSHKPVHAGTEVIILRHEFDPDTGEYLRTVKEGDSNA